MYKILIKKKKKPSLNSLFMNGLITIRSKVCQRERESEQRKGGDRRDSVRIFGEKMNNINQYHRK